MRTRNEIDYKYKWDITSYCADWQDFEKRLNKLADFAKEIECFEGKLVVAENILDCMKKCSLLSREMEILGCFCSLKQSEDSGDSVAEMFSNKLSQIESLIETKIAFVDSELNLLDDEFLFKLSRLEEFEDFKLNLLEIIRQKSHTLSKAEEKLLAQLSEFSGSFSDVFDMFDTSDVKFEDVVNESGETLPLNNANYSAYLYSNDLTLRRSAHKNMQIAYGSFEKTLATNYMYKVKKSATMSKIRKFSSCLEASMFYEEVNPNIYQKLVKSVRENLKIFHDYFKQKSMMMNLVGNMKIPDLYAPAVPMPEKKYSFDEAFELVKKALSPLGGEYVSVLQKAKDERWIDIYPNKNKATGAFASGAYGLHPVVLLNFNGTLDSVFTLAHELGHALHSYYSDKNNCYEKAGYAIFVAEVASTTNEMLLLKYLLKNAKTNHAKLFLCDKYMSMYKSTVHRQTMFAEFEEFAHKTYEEGSPFSTEVLTNHYLHLNEEYFGKDVVVDDYVKYEWLRIPHFYNAFYVYKYATGLICADALSENIIKGKTENYFNFLKAGCTLPPPEILKNAGVDLESDETYKIAFNSVKKMIKKIGELNG